eukprot:CAMPEP_0201979290 /NCGR_PEP_ID=MMETSP0904-20121228/66794_1 /ASSEMBLY_ACC=CAM_ASM_000553 /TAXON_ID=420261 /ORGANISM="Thalassiosira antarctica, Strain CCMP982" /LENGTH=49 /DNA_ID=CAMNT_0048531255 /DNA_START=243 /DNA_END=392 /DNA_ORIENTATION=-
MPSCAVHHNGQVNGVTLSFFLRVTLRIVARALDMDTGGTKYSVFPRTER